MPLPLAAALIPAALKAGTGIYQSVKASNALKNLGKMPEYSISPELQNSYNRAERMATQGYTPQEAAAFSQRLARNNNTSFQRGITLGGGSLAKALNSAVLSNNIDAQLGFAANDASLRRSNIRYADSVGSEVSGQRNRNTAQQLAYRMLVEQNLGMAKQQGRNNVVEALGGVPYNLMQMEYMNGLNKEAPTEDVGDYFVPSETGTTMPMRMPASLQKPNYGSTAMKTPGFGSIINRSKTQSPVFNR